jgi:uncharacterized protein (DUF2062 family)
MPKKFIKKIMPDHKTIRDHKHMQFFGDLLHDPNLFHFNRRSASGAFAVGLFFAWVPVPFQMLLAAAAAIIFRVNLPLSVALVWLSNPVTMPPLFYGAYLLGAEVLGTEAEEFEFELSWEWLSTSLGNIWEPFLLGCGVLAITSSILGYFAIRGLWRLHLIQHIKERRERYKRTHHKQS